MKRKYYKNVGIISLLLLFAANVFAQNAVFTASSLAPQNGISLNISTDINGVVTDKDFCSGTKLDVIEINSSASLPTEKYVEVVASSDITSIELDAHYNSSGSGVQQLVVAYWGATFSTIPLGIQYADIVGYDQPCGVVHTLNFPAGVRIVRMYRRVKYDGTELGTGSNIGDGKTTRIGTVTVYAGPPPPELSVSPSTLTGITYTGAGPSTSKTFDVSGTDLDGANITITGSTNYEVSSDGSTYGPTAIIAAGAGTLSATTAYVRLKSGLSISLYNNETITISGGGAASSVTVDASGSVTAGALIPLLTPAVGAGSVPSFATFQANWTSVANATGYTINIYQGASLVKSQYAAGQATSNTIITGLTESTAYTYKVVAVGDGLTYSDSPESLNSGIISTTAPPAAGSCEIKLYETDFSDWLALSASGSSSTARSVVGGAGDGFIITEDTEIVPSTPIFNNTGTSGRTITFPPFDFNNGGTVYIEGYNTTGSSISGISGATGVFDAATGNPVTIGDIKNMAYDIYFELPLSLNGLQSLTFSNFRGNWSSIKICTNPTGTAQMAVSNYMEAPAQGMSLSGAVGGAIVPGIAIVKAWNVNCGVDMSIVGENAALFDLPVASLTQAEALVGTPVIVNFSPSVMAGVSNAQLKLSSTCGAPDYYLNLEGFTSSGAGAEITTSTATVPFWASLIAKANNEISISGVNLTGDVSLSITGPNATSFSIPVSSISRAQASSGYPLTITYTGDIVTATHSATLVISSPGAADVSIPLSGETLNEKPVLYDLEFIVVPSGSGYAETNLAGTRFLDGTKINVEAIPETGYNFDKWGDGLGGSYANRTITISDKKKGVIFVDFTTGVVIPPPDPTATFVAYEPLGLGDDEFTASWSLVAGATSYLVTVYDENKAVLTTIPITDGVTNSTLVSDPGITAGKFYSYKVETTGGVLPAEETTIAGPFKTTGGINTYVCGEQP